MDENFPSVGILPREAQLDESGNIRGLSRYRGNRMEISLPEEFVDLAVPYAMERSESFDAVFARQTVNLVTLQSINWVLQEELDEDCFVNSIEEKARQYDE